MIVFERRWVIVEITPCSLRGWLVLLGLLSLYWPSIEVWWQQSVWSMLWQTIPR